MGAEHAAVEPDVGGEEGASDPKQHSAVVVWPGETGAVPDDGAAGNSRLLEWHRHRLPAATAAGGKALGLTLTERLPGALPLAQGADSARALTQRQADAIVHRTYAPSAVLQNLMITSGSARRTPPAAPVSSSATTLPPKPAPMRRAPRQPGTPHARSTSASTAGVETSKSSRRLRCDAFNSSPRAPMSRASRARANACTRSISDSTCRRRLGIPLSASRRRWLYGVSASERWMPVSITARTRSPGNGTSR